MVVLVGAVIAPWSTVATVDERTYLEMTAAVAETGLPRFSNGPVETFPELQARWNLADGTQIWGVMAPGMSYLFAPFFLIGGIGLLIRINIALIAVIALGGFDLGRRVTGDPILGVASAYVAIMAVPVWSSSLSLTPYSIAIAAIVWSLSAAVRALELRSRQYRWAAVSGLLGGLAALCHLLVLPIALSLGLVLLWKRGRLGLIYGVAALPAAIAAGLLNRARFGSWNPVSDGPCAWKGCPESGIDPQSVGQMLIYGAPFLVVVLVSALGVSILRPRRWISVVVVLTAGILVFSIPLLREPAQRYGLLTWALLVSPNVLPFGPEYRLAPDGFGLFVGPNVVKGLLQGSPFLVLALLGCRRVRYREVLLVPVLAHLAMLILRANMPWDLALGHSFLSFRYLMPIAPLLAVLAVAALRDLDWNLHWLAAAAVIAALLRWWLAGPHDDFDLLRRQFLLRSTVTVAFCLLAAVWYSDRTTHRLASKAALCLSALALGMSAGITIGVDFTATARFRTKNDLVVEVTERSLPDRLALVAYPDELDAVLSLLPEKDLEYLDLLEVTQPETVVELTRYWQDEGRPVFLRLPADPEFSLTSGLVARVVDPAVGLVELSVASGQDH
jgi:hypothetical protein